MTRPTYKEWKSNSQSTPDGLVAQTVQQRILAALAAITSVQNPDGTTL
jgi:hypothetical protein